MTSQISPQLDQRLRAHLQTIYPDHDPANLAQDLIDTFWPSPMSPRHTPRDTVQTPWSGTGLWSENDTILITYGDSIRDADEKPLQTLKHFLKSRLSGVISGLHILPFFPFTSDDGFAVRDYHAVNPELGNWQDISEIADDFRLMADVVLNHASASCDWFKQFERGEQPGASYFVEADPTDDLSQVVRPRPSPLLRRTETANGDKYVWCTFGHDQIDLDFSNPKVLLEFIEIMRAYIDAGVRVFRLDAVAFLWKRVGTSCIHLDETHEIIRLMRTLVDFDNKPIILITETNVPNHENITYFGNQNEAHAIYNFSLPPLTLHALLNGTSEALNSWVMSMPPALPGCAYLNFTASHDGIGLRPCEGLLDWDEVDTMIETAKSFGGTVSMRSNQSGLNTPYELNISLFDALAGTIAGRDKWQIQRFLCSQIIMMSLEGIPAFYIHSLLATPNDTVALRLTKHNRAINRHKWPKAELNDCLDDPKSHHAIVFDALKALIAKRTAQPAFHPNATQYTLQLDKHLFGVWRQSLDRRQSIFVIANMSNETQDLPLAKINLISNADWTDIISGEAIVDTRQSITLQPYQCLWLTNAFVPTPHENIPLR